MNKMNKRDKKVAKTPVVTYWTFYKHSLVHLGDLHFSEWEGKKSIHYAGHSWNYKDYPPKYISSKIQTKIDKIINKIHLLNNQKQKLVNQAEKEGEAVPWEVGIKSEIK